MAPQSHFSVSWEKYQHNMCDGFSTLQQNGEFVDMTIAADGHLVRVHQLVISLASPFLKQMIQSAPCPNPVIFLNNVPHQILCNILEYIYTGEALVPADKLTLFIEIGKSLHIKGLEDMLQYQEEKYQPEPISIQTIKPPGSNMVQVMVGDKDDISQPIILPSTARNISVNRSMPDLPQGEINSSQYEVRAEDVHEMEYFDDGAADDGHHSPPPSQPPSFQPPPSPAADPRSKKTPLQYTVSNRGSLQLILNRYVYNQTSRSKNGKMRRWKCVDYRNNKCPAVVTTEDNLVSNRIGMHNHHFHDKRVMAKMDKNAVFSAIQKAEEVCHQNPDEEES